MNKLLEGYNKTKEFLVCVDSDGCAMDTMEIKHRKCFAPEMIRVWNLYEKEESITNLWHHINLYSQTRGINRFKGLAMTFEELTKQGVLLENIEDLINWVNRTKELSNPSLEREIENTQSICLQKVLEWSYAVNRAITELENEDRPFENVEKGLEIISKMADIAVVSSANGEALDKEWHKHKLAPYTKVLLGQEAGTKSICIQNLKLLGYEEDKVLMVGDAPGDLEAAKNNGVKFYPILVGKESFSWERLYTEAISYLMEGKFDEIYQEALIKEFTDSLK